MNIEPQPTQPKVEDEESKRATTSRVFPACVFVIVAGLMAGANLSPDQGILRRRIVPAILFGAIGLGGLVNNVLNLRFYREGQLLNKRVTMESEPVRYWLLFGVVTVLSIAALVVGILFAAGLLGKTRG